MLEGLQTTGQANLDGVLMTNRKAVMVSWGLCNQSTWIAVSILLHVIACNYTSIQLIRGNL